MPMQATITSKQELIDHTYFRSVVTCLDFHPKEEGLLVTAGLDRKAQLFSVNRARQSQKVQTLLLPDLPIYTARFILEGSQILLSGNRKHFYYYDLASNKLEKIPGIQGGIFSNASNNDNTNLSRLFTSTAPGSDLFAIASGESGQISVLSQRSKKLLYELKMSSSSCTQVAFGPGADTKRIYTVGDQAEIYVWDVRHTKKCVAKVADEGSFNTTHIAISADGSQIATGSHSGVVNLYKVDQSETPLT